MHQPPKRLALACKLMGAVLWLGAGAVKIELDISQMRASSPPREAPQDWGTSAYFHRMYLEILVVSVVVLVAVIPNRRLIFSPIALGISLVVALFPLVIVLIHNFSGPFVTLRDLFDPFGLMLLTLLFGPLPISLLLGFWRHRSGAEVRYA